MDGILIIDKPARLTSHDVIARVRRIIGQRRVGHTGTLDPFATGVLVVLVGQATRLAQFLSGAEKEYLATVRFGYATTTGDITGERREGETRDLAELTEGEIETALAKLRGEIEQVPPMYSAKKIDGKKLYELARSGKEVERQPVRVKILELEALPGNGDLLRINEDGTCDLSLRVVCSAGTYIRALAESLGELLGTGAHLFQLRRTRAGTFTIEDSVGLDRLQEQADAENLETFILPAGAALSELACVHLTADEAVRTQHGVPLRTKFEWPDGRAIRMLDAKGLLIAVGFYDEASSTLRPRVVLSPPE